MPASLTRSRSREFLASEPLQPRLLRIQPRLVKKHMYYPRREIPTLFPIVHSKPSQFLLSMQNRNTDVMTFFPLPNYFNTRSNHPFFSIYLLFGILAPRVSIVLPLPTIDSIPFSSLRVTTTSNLFLDHRKMCLFKSSNGFLDSGLLDSRAT